MAPTQLALGCQMTFNPNQRLLGIAVCKKIIRFHTPTLCPLRGNASDKYKRSPVVPVKGTTGSTATSEVRYGVAVLGGRLRGPVVQNYQNVVVLRRIK